MELKNLHFSFANQILFQNLNLRIDDNQLTVLLGPSGCGKSTLLRLFAGLIPTAQLISNTQTRLTSFVFQESTLLNWKTAYENILLPFTLSKSQVDTRYFQQLISTLKIFDCLSKYPNELSGGQKMRVSIARALITKPQVLFMDEPFSSLDEPTRLNLQDELLQLQNQLKMTLLFVTHSFYEAVYLADRILILSSAKPSQIVFDEIKTKNFASRFDMTYLQQVQNISEIFASSNT
jgi:NitT/TauT family transport system ATP-binding protein